MGGVPGGNIPWAGRTRKGEKRAVRPAKRAHPRPWPASLLDLVFICPDLQTRERREGEYSDAASHERHAK